MVQKRDSPSMVESVGREGSVLLEEEEGATMGSVAFGVEVVDVKVDWPWDDSTTSSDSRLTGSPIVVSFASFDNDGRSLF